jgi:hypothetical protein
VVEFKKAPEASAELRFNFLKDPMDLHTDQIILSGSANERNTKVKLNGKDARPEDLVFEEAGKGKTNLRLQSTVRDSSDYYKIQEKNGLDVTVTITN